MENSSDIKAPISDEIVCLMLKNLLKEAGNIRPLIQHGTRGSSLPAVVDLIEEPEDQTVAAFLENKVASSPMIKTEPKWDHYEIEYIPSSNFNQNKSEPQLVVVLEKLKVFKTESSEHIVDISNFSDLNR